MMPLVTQCQEKNYCIQGKFCPFTLLALWQEGEFKTGLIELYVKYYVRKYESG